jgi:hypothetical protein
MSFTITTDRATTPRAHTLLDIFRHQRNRPNRLPRSPSCASASRNRPVGGGLPMVEQSGHHVDVTASGVKQQSAPRSMQPRRSRQAVASAALSCLCRSAIALAAVSAKPETRGRAASSLETRAAIGNYGWKLRFTLETGLTGNR